MKSKKLFLPTVVFAVAIFLIILCSLILSIAQKPTVTEGEFPFSITYELAGERKTIDGVVSVYYDKNGGYTDSKTRYYVGKIGDLEEGATYYILQDNEDGRVELNTNLYPDYLMGDPEYEYFDSKAFAPEIYYYDKEENCFEDEETLAEHGIKLIDYEYPTPIENSFVFSHFSILNCEVVLPSLGIAVLAFLAILIFVKKETDYVRKTIDVISTVLNFIIAIFLLPYLTVCAILLDVMGDNDSIFNQVFYFLPALTVFGIAASVALRRKGYGKGGLFSQLAAPAIFAAILLIGGIFGLL